MDKVCRHCNLIWHNADNIHFCTSCGRPLEMVNDWNDGSENRQQGGPGYGGDPGYNGYAGPGGYGTQGYGGGPGYNGYGGMQRREIPRSSILESYQKFWQNYFDFNGRSRRSDYWQVFLMNFIIGIVLSCLSVIPLIGLLFRVIYVLYVVAAFIPNLSLSVRRLHDIGKSGLYYLFILIPIVGPILLLVWAATDTEPGETYGRNPKWEYF